MIFYKSLFLSSLIFLNIVVSAQNADKIDVGTILQDYIDLPEPDYKWHDTGITFTTLFGGQAHVLNVTSLKWLNDTIYTAYGGHVWTHHAVVIIPKNLVYKNASMLFMASINAHSN